MPTTTTKSAGKGRGKSRGKGLTVAKNKVAVLLRIPRELEARIRRWGRGQKPRLKRTPAINRLLETHPEMRPSARPKPKSASKSEPR